MLEENVILVDQQDNIIGKSTKIEAHDKGLLHRAFSVFIFNNKNELMLQQRAAHKYHTPNLWTNTCCSHQRENENSIEAGMRRLQEEMGFSVPLTFVDTFLYKASFDNGLIEHELDHILIGKYNQPPNINQREVRSWKWITIENLKKDINENKQQYTPWLKIICGKNIDWQSNLK